jgi:hypothetical protein
MTMSDIRVKNSEVKDLVAVAPGDLVEIAGGLWCEILNLFHPHTHPPADPWAAVKESNKTSDLPQFDSL